MRKSVIVVMLLFAISAAAAAEVPKIAVYVTGGRDAGEERALAAFILSALVKGGKYEAVERSEDFVTQINREMETQHSGSVDDSQIRRVGIRAGVRFVCVTDITPARGSYLLSARIIDVETAEVAAIGVAGSDMESMEEMEILANDIVAKLLGLKSAGQVLGESERDKRRQEREEAERRVKMERERRRREEARERDEAAVRREKERADRVERREQDRAERAERRERERAERGRNIRSTLGGILFPDLGEEYGYGDWDGKWHFYSLGFIPPRVAFGTGFEYQGILTTIRKHNGRTWEPRIDVMAVSMYLHGYELPKADGIGEMGWVTVFNGWTVDNPSAKSTKWRWYLGYGASWLEVASKNDTNERNTGIGVGGQVGMEYAVVDDRGKHSGIVNFDIRPMYRIIPMDMRNSYFGITVGFSASFCKGIYADGMDYGTPRYIYKYGGGKYLPKDDRGRHPRQPYGFGEPGVLPYYYETREPAALPAGGGGGDSLDSEIESLKRELRGFDE